VSSQASTQTRNETTLNGRTALITGASGNLGRAVADVMKSRGANVALIDRKRERLEQIYGSEDSTTAFAIADLADTDQVATAARTVRDRFGTIDILANIAGGFRMGDPVHATRDDDWTFLFEINARTMLNAARAVVPTMIAAGSGKIVNIGAFGALRGGANMGAYAASKSAVIRLTESMSAELRDKGINVNCVLPTIIDTPENRKAMPDADPTKWVAPDDLARVIAFLASDDARAIHGAAIPVTGLV
jgi:NAD(P)-dependent dehydrogenase (short-subunit alcohol dehydrogenase family)